MSTSLSEMQKLELLLELVREANRQIQAGGQPRLNGFLKGKGVSAEEAQKLVDQWAELVGQILEDSHLRGVKVSERTMDLQTGPLRLLLACLVPDYASRLEVDARYEGAPENERRARIALQGSEVKSLLRASLIEGAFEGT